MALGRPTKFSEAYCNDVIETMATGLSLTAFAGEIGVARSTINEWMGAHPQFSEAVKVGKAKRTAALEKQMLAMENGPAVTARIFALKNADPEEWRDKQHVEHSVDESQAERILRYQGRLNG
jgi:transposase